MFFQRMPVFQINTERERIKDILIYEIETGRLEKEKTEIDSEKGLFLYELPNFLVDFGRDADLFYRDFEKDKEEFHPKESIKEDNSSSIKDNIPFITE